MLTEELLTELCEKNGIGLEKQTSAGHSVRYKFYMPTDEPRYTTWDSYGDWLSDAFALLRDYGIGITVEKLTKED